MKLDVQRILESLCRGGLSKEVVEGLHRASGHRPSDEFLEYLADHDVIDRKRMSGLRIALNGYVHGPLSALMGPVNTKAALACVPPPLPSDTLRSPPIPNLPAPSNESTSSWTIPIEPPVHTANEDSSSLEGSLLPPFWGSSMPPGTNLGRYVLQEKLGEGSSATTYRGYHSVLGMPVAVKVFAEQSQTVDFLSEARSLALIDHPNVVRVLDADRHGSTPYIVFEYVDSMTLDELIAACGRLSARRVGALALQLARGLSAAWSRRILHRDVKPSNILIKRDGEAKLLDFGLAIVATHGAPDGRFACGSPAYMAPEQIHSPSLVDFRADMYGLGATLYQAATGKPPVLRGTPRETMQAQLHEYPPRIEDEIEDFDLEVAGIIHGLLEKDREHRPSSWPDLVARLESNASVSGNSSSRSGWSFPTITKALSSVWAKR